MKKTIAFLLSALLTLSFSAAFADSVPMSKEDQMVGLVKSFLEENEFPYEYDDYTFTVPFAVENSMEYVYMTVYIYDDMLAVSADAPVQGTGDVFEKMAVFAALVNNEIYYAQFRVELDADKVYVSCRSCNLVEDVIPGENELFYLFAMPQSYMEDYGDGILAVLDGGDPYEAFEACCAGLRHFCSSDCVLDGKDVFAGENAVRRDGDSHIRRAHDAGLSHSSPRILQSLRAPYRGRAAPAD